MRIATNVQAIAANRHLSQNTHNLNNSLEHLASGSRINKAGDDAAGLAISEKLKASVRSLKQADRNANDGISLIQTAEGAMNEVSNMLIRMRELSIQASSDSIGPRERTYVDKEVQQLKSEIERIAQSTEYNGSKLLNGTAETLEFQVGMHNNPELDRLQYDAPNQVVTVGALGVEDLSTRDKESAQQNLEKIDVALDRLNENRADLGAIQNRLMSTSANLQIYVENLSSANSRIRDTDLAQESSELTKHNILTQSNVAMLGQANSKPQLAMQLL